MALEPAGRMGAAARVTANPHLAQPMIHIEDVLLFAISEKGATYVFGAEASVREDHPTKIDCSELVEWSCGKAGVQPVVPDGARFQFAHCQRHNTVLSVTRALRTRGALM